MSNDQLIAECLLAALDDINQYRAVIKLMLSTPGNVKGRAIAEHLINEIEGKS